MLCCVQSHPLQKPKIKLAFANATKRYSYPSAETGERKSDMIHLQLCLFRVSSNLNAAYFHKAYFPNRRRESKRDKEREREADKPEDRERAFSQLVD